MHTCKVFKLLINLNRKHHLWLELWFLVSQWCSSIIYHLPTEYKNTTYLKFYHTKNTTEAKSQSKAFLEKKEKRKKRGVGSNVENSNLGIKNSFIECLMSTYYVTVEEDNKGPALSTYFEKIRTITQVHCKLQWHVNNDENGAELYRCCGSTGVVSSRVR